MENLTEEEKKRRRKERDSVYRGLVRDQRRRDKKWELDSAGYPKNLSKAKRLELREQFNQKLALQFELAPIGSGIDPLFASQYIQNQMSVIVGKASTYFPDINVEKRVKAKLLAAGNIRNLFEFDLGRVEVLSRLAPGVFEASDLGVVRKYFALFHQVPVHKDLISHWEERIAGSKQDQSLNRFVQRNPPKDKDGNIVEVIALPDRVHRHVGGTDQTFTRREQSKWFVGFCIQHHAMFHDTVKFEPEETTTETTTAEENEPVDTDGDENQLVIVQAEDDPSDVQLRLKKNVEIVDLTLDEESEGLVYYRKTPPRLPEDDDPFDYGKQN
jgi:hypothetical protein